MENLKVQRVHEIITMLRDIDVDGETMQYILKKVGMEDQMLKQLVGTANEEDLNYYLNLRTIEKIGKKSC